MTHHAFLWRPGVITDLGTLAGDFSSDGSDMNEIGKVVGASKDASGNPRAFLWQHGAMTDLNELLPSSSPLSLVAGGAINSRSEITGVALLKGPQKFTLFWQLRVAEIGSRVGSAKVRVGILRPREAKLAHGRRSRSPKIFARYFSNDWASPDRVSE
jgi:probable HAF family extracellular repeat protein